MSDLSEWVGRERVEEDSLDLFPARGMSAVLDRDPSSVQEGSLLPRGWHWLYFKPVIRRSELGDDGHERRGAFLPPVGLPRRMWAGGKLTFTDDLHIGERVRRRSTIETVEEKEGRSGRLVFVNVRHRIETDRGLAVDEAQNLVYRDGLGGTGEGPAPPASPAWSEPFVADPLTLFRFSALTFNGHRIHYDQPYSMREEGYPGIVVHGPLLALLLLDGAARNAGRSPLRFAYRAVSPLFAGEPFRLEGAGGLPLGAAGESEVWAAGPRGMAMRAMAGWEAS
jgi:3-methylfumaryl-CoA hydratase